MKNEHDHKKQNSQKTVTQSYRACKMAASCIDLNVNMHYSNNVDTIVHVFLLLCIQRRAAVRSRSAENKIR